MLLLLFIIEKIISLDSINKILSTFVFYLYFVVTRCKIYLSYYHRPTGVKKVQVLSSRARTIFSDNLPENELTDCAGRSLCNMCVYLYAPLQRQCLPVVTADALTRILLHTTPGPYPASFTHASMLPGYYKNIFKANHWSTFVMEIII